ncbi:hypothetical protein H9L39_11339 [Fusarium oxysporum f. sp. albedinis]|jgi:hypothetical protein|nr:hypothetical protein H9L39_11339 [Fusarium oxysporum f. sp. albedinis]
MLLSVEEERSVGRLALAVDKCEKVGHNKDGNLMHAPQGSQHPIQITFGHPFEDPIAFCFQLRYSIDVLQP